MIDWKDKLNKLRIITCRKIPKNRFHNGFQDEFILELRENSSVYDLCYKEGDCLFDFNQKIIEKVQKEEIDLLISTIHTDILFTESITEIKKFAKTLFFAEDNYIIPYSYTDIVNLYDLIWFTQRGTENFFNRRKANFIVLPYGCYSKNQFVCKELIRKVVFVGSPYGSRINIVNKLLANKIPVALYNSSYIDNYKKTQQFSFNTFSLDKNLLLTRQGHKIIVSKLINLLFKRSKLNLKSDFLEILPSPTNPLEVASIYSNYALCLSNNSARNTDILKNPVNVVHLRSFEIPSFGGVQFCRESNEIREYFSETDEIILYKNNIDMINKAKYFIYDSTDDELRNIQTKAYLRFQSEHTLKHRFKKVFDRIGLG